tara:strand:- start:245 stop:571 length:327 start_codon:yes stop_codon:yes gene_type:complete
MKKTINRHEFRNAFNAIRPENFSYEGLELLFDYFEQLEDDLGEEIEMDVIAICCDYSEDDFQVVADEYEIEVTIYDEDPIEAVCQALRDKMGFAEYTSDNTIVYCNVG